ncbi:MAG: tryptophan--tRNA ligase [Candidatus Micrarchaeota archaeon]
MEDKIDPWSSQMPQDMLKLYERFGLETIPAAVKKRLSHSHLFSRDIIVAQRDLGAWIKDADLPKKKAAIMSGIKPSGDFHLGSKQTAEEIVFFQKEFGAKVFYGIADLEAHADNGLSLEECRKNAVSNVADLLALGLDEKNAYIYRQSKEQRVMNRAFLLSSRVTRATFEALYGERDMGLYMSVLAQVADIFLPQHEDFGGPKRVLVPVGFDQDPHIRLARDLAFKEKIVLPAATYHKFIRNLKGEAKMSKRDPDSMIWLSEDEASIKRKLMRTLTGGRETAEEQRRLGGEIEKCVIYDLCKTHFELDEISLAGRYERCTKGKMLCGECKKEVVELALEWFAGHREKREKKMGLAEKIIEGQD